MDTFVKVLEEGLERIAATEATDGQALSPEGAAAEALVRQANEAGGDDNISVVSTRTTPRAKG